MPWTSEKGGLGLVSCVIVLGLGFTTPARSQPAQAAASGFDVTHYEAMIEPDIVAKTVKGRARIDFVLNHDATPAIELDSGALIIDSINEGGVALEFAKTGSRLRVVLRAGTEGRRKRAISIDYHGAPRYGLEFAPEKSQTYTIFSTSQWLPCVDAPSDRATLRLTVVVPKGLSVVGNGTFVGAHEVAAERVAHEWTLDRPMPTYTFGFVAGSFVEAGARRGRTRLRFLSTDASTQEPSRIFVDTADMLEFFEDRAGVKYSGRVYTQVLVKDTIGQELTDFSLMSEEYGRRVLSDPQAIGLIAHELAHQWWGNSVTCIDWTHFWLNEGIATFMAAAYREHRFGRDVYLKDVGGWRARYARVRDAGHDKSLVFAEWNKPTSDDRAIVYQKGALVLHELRAVVGETSFWKGVRAYTRRHFGRSVTTLDFQREMEKATGRDLRAFFDRWVYLKP